MTSPDDREVRLSARLAPEQIRATLAFAELFQITHELIKRTIVDDLKGFYGYKPAQ